MGKKRVNVGMVISTKIVEKFHIRNDWATTFLCVCTYVMRIMLSQVLQRTENYSAFLFGRRRRAR